MKSASVNENVKEASGIRGRLHFTNYALETPRAFEIAAILETAHDMASEVYDRLVAELKSICATREYQVDNLVVLTGRAVFARRLVGDLTYTGTVNYGALGTSTSAVASGNTQLGTEVARKLFARRTRTNAQVSFDFFYSKSDTDGTYEEFGMFIDGTSTANSGQLFNRALTGGWTKTNNEAMTVSVTVDINDA